MSHKMSSNILAVISFSLFCLKMGVDYFLKNINKVENSKKDPKYHIWGIF